MSRAVYVVGFMGSGKSTIGRLLAERLDLPFVDLDDDIEAAEGRTISEVFSLSGEAQFRDTEHEALARRTGRARNGEAFVLALGGGAFTFARNRELLQGAGTSIWLDCPFDRALRRVAGFAHRPLAKDPAQFQALFTKRQADYALADIRIPITSDEPGDAVESILEALR